MRQSPFLRLIQRISSQLIAGACALLALLLVPTTAHTQPELQQLSTTELEAQLESIHQELDMLSKFTMRSGVGSIGHRSVAHEKNSASEWIQIDLLEPSTFDAIVLVPTLWRSSKEGLLSDGFPDKFRIFVGNADSTTGTLLASYGPYDEILPRIAPLTIHCEGTTASWVRIEAESLTPRAWDGKFILQLSEVLIFQGQENIALHQPVTVSSRDNYQSQSARNPKYLVDGMMPYLMDTSLGEQSLAYVSHLGVGDQPSITLDLGSQQRINQINLHATDVTDTIPQAAGNDYGIPTHFTIEGANQADFTDAQLLGDYYLTSTHDIGPIIMRRFKETLCRYVKITAIEPYQTETSDNRGSLIGFAEIVVLSKGENVALNAPIQLNYEIVEKERPTAALTDGHNLYGKILPIRTWLADLEMRHELERTRPLIEALLKERYARQKTNLNRLLWVVAILIAGTIIIILIDRNMRLKAVSQTRERIAADLHDELGANLHAIGLLSQLAEKSQSNPEKVSRLLPKLHRLTVRTGAAARNCTNMLEAKELYQDVTAEMSRTAQRLLADLHYEIKFEGESILEKLPARKRIDLCLFHKEALTNIIRHSGATDVQIELIADKKLIRLTIADNGQGISKNLNDGVPKSLSRRSRLLGARIEVSSPSNGDGTRITLKLNNRKFIS